MMSTMKARVLSMVLALLLTLLPLAALAEEAAGGELFTLQIANISVFIEGMEEAITFLPVLTLAAGLDEADERGVFQLLLTVQEMTAANMVLAYEDGLIKAYVENMTSYIELPLEGLEDMMAETMGGEVDLNGLPVGPAFLGKFSDPAYGEALNRKLLDALAEGEYASWYKGEAEIEQDGVTATVKQYEFTINSMRELGALVDAFVALDEDLATVMQQFLAGAGMEGDNFEAIYAELGEEAELSMAGTMYFDAANTIAGVEMQMTVSEPDGETLAEMAMTQYITQIDAQNAHMAFTMQAADPKNPDGNNLVLALDFLRVGDGAAQADELAASFVFQDQGEEVFVTLAANVNKDATDYAFSGELNVSQDEMMIVLSATFDGQWQEADGMTTYSGPFRLALDGDMGAYAIGADVVAVAQPLPAGQLLSADLAAVNPLTLDEDALEALGTEFQMAMMSAMGVLMQDPAITSLLTGDAEG